MLPSASWSTWCLYPCGFLA